MAFTPIKIQSNATRLYSNSLGQTSLPPNHIQRNVGIYNRKSGQMISKRFYSDSQPEKKLLDKINDYSIALANGRADNPIQILRLKIAQWVETHSAAEAALKFAQKYPHETKRSIQALLSVFTCLYLYYEYQIYVLENRLKEQQLIHEQALEESRINYEKVLKATFQKMKEDIEASIEKEKNHEFQAFLGKVKNLLDAKKIDTDRHAYISYAWELEGHVQKPLGYLKKDLERLGMKVFYDLANMDGVMRKRMAESIDKSQHVFFIGAPALKDKINNDPGGNIAFEWNTIKKHPLYINQTHDFLFPILHAGNIENAFPNEVREIFIRQNPGGKSYFDVLAGLSCPRGIILSLFPFDQNDQNAWTEYQEHWKFFDLNRKNIENEKEKRLHNITDPALKSNFITYQWKREYVEGISAVREAQSDNHLQSINRPAV